LLGSVYKKSTPLLLKPKKLDFIVHRLEPLPPNKKIFFAADFHLGASSYLATQEREKKIISWLDYIQPTTQALFLLGDIFDCWFEYKHVVPKGFVRLQAKLASFTDQGIPVYFFLGNHEMAVYDYFVHELKLSICTKPMSFYIGNTSFLVGHGDEWGSSWPYRLFKRWVHTNPGFKWIFSKIHPDMGLPWMGWMSEKSRNKNKKKEFLYKEDRIANFCKRQIEPYIHHDFYIFGHLHTPYHATLNARSQYYNVGDWVKHSTYGAFDGKQFTIQCFL
jgi:UDP-2,3-diacylglucosamine hydrolase